MVPGSAAHFLVVIGQVHDELIHARREWRELFLVPVEPVFRLDTRLHGDEVLNRDLFGGHCYACGRAMSSRCLQKKREVVVISKFSIYAEKLVGRNHAGHVHIEMSDGNTAALGAVDLRM